MNYSKVKFNKCIRLLKPIVDAFSSTIVGIEREYVIESIFITKNNRIGVVILGSMGFRCGYISIGENDLLEDYEYYEIDVHGGLTYQGKDNIDEVIKNKLTPEEFNYIKKNITYIGFDCGHYTDGNSYADLIEYGVEVEHQFSIGGQVKTLDYVKNEIQKMDSQLKKTNIKVRKKLDTLIQTRLVFERGRFKFKGKKNG